MNKNQDKSPRNLATTSAIRPNSNTVSSRSAQATPRLVLTIGQISIFSALIVVGTSLARIPLPAPLFEITLAPAFYLAIAVLYPWKVSLSSTAIGSAIGEAINVALSGGLLIYIPGIVWARAPEALIMYGFRKKSPKGLALAMALATVYETAAFFIPDSLFYAYALFSYADSPQGLYGGVLAALGDLGTLVDLVWIPLALGAILAVRKAFRVQFFD